MKKAGIFLVSLLFLSILTLTIISAQDEAPGLDKVEINPETGFPEGVPTTKEELEDKASNFSLGEEWKKVILDTSVIGPIIKFFDKVLSPISKLLLKREVDFSWVYFFTLAIWVIIVYPTYLAMKQALNMGWITSLLSGIIIASLGLRVIPASWLEFQVTLIWKAIITGIIIFIIALIVFFSKKIEKSMKKEREQRRERKAQTVEKIHDIEIKANQ